jgi:ABC-type glycerol-3-phosphate transport system substrate-binding protein
MVDQFNQTNEWGIFVIEMAPGSSGLVDEKFTELMLNGIPPEVIVASPAHLMRYDQLHENILDLNAYAASDKFGLSTLEQQDFVPAFWLESLHAGKRYGIPAQRTSDMLFYNVTWAKELGFPNAPESWEEFREQACAANALMRKDTDTANDGLGGWIINSGALTTLSWLYVFGSDPAAMDAIQFSSAESTTAFEQLLKLMNDSCGWLSRLPDAQDYFANRQALFYSGSMEDLLKQERTNGRLESEDDWAVLPYPRGEDTPIMLAEGLDYGITHSSSEKQLAAWLFVRWLADPEQQAWILRKAGTLPLGEKVLTLAPDIVEETPRWQNGVDLMAYLLPLPATPELDLAKMVLEDGTWALYRTGLKAEGIPALLTQIDDIIAELAAYRE